ARQHFLPRLIKISTQFIEFHLANFKGGNSEKVRILLQIQEILEFEIQLLENLTVEDLFPTNAEEVETLAKVFPGDLEEGEEEEGEEGSLPKLSASQK